MPLMRWRVRLNGDRNIGLVSAFSARALKVDGSSLRVFFHHDGHNPQRIVVARLDVERRLRQPVERDQLLPSG